MITINKNLGRNQTKNGKPKKRVLVLKGEQNILEREQSKSFIKNKTRSKRESWINLFYYLKHLYLFSQTSIKFFSTMKSLPIFQISQLEANCFRNLKFLLLNNQRSTKKYFFLLIIPTHSITRILTTISQSHSWTILSSSSKNLK